VPGLPTVTDAADVPTLADDEAALAAHALDLVSSVEAVIQEWIRWSIATPAPELAMSVGDQTEAPLQVLRRGVRFATQVLVDADVAPVQRDDFARRAFPDDLYNLSPASFADVHPTLHEPGLIWGAAKAHVHLRRRREAGLDS